MKSSDQEKNEKMNSIETDRNSNSSDPKSVLFQNANTYKNMTLLPKTLTTEAVVKIQGNVRKIESLSVLDSIVLEGMKIM